MSTIISMQDIRLSLASIADRVAKGEQFTVIRNSRPAFRLVPCEDYPEAGAREPGRPLLTVREVRERLTATAASRRIRPEDVDAAIREARTIRTSSSETPSTGTA